MDVAINTIGGKLVLLRPTGPSGHWLDVQLSRFAPGAVVTAVLPGRRRLDAQVQAGSSYLSSEDPRVHFGLGAATTVGRLTVRYPWGGESRVARRRGEPGRRDRLRRAPVSRRRARPRRRARELHARDAARPRSRGSGTTAAVDVLRRAARREPVQARDLFDLSAMRAWALRPEGLALRHRSGPTQSRGAAISYAAYRLLVWRASFDANLDRTFALLTERLRSLCYSPDFTSTAGNSPAALGNRIAAAAIAAGRHDGSTRGAALRRPELHAAERAARRGAAGSTVHDPTFWQPLALGRRPPQGGRPRSRRRSRRFDDAQWGHVRAFAPARPMPIDPGAPPSATRRAPRTSGPRSR